MFTEDFDTFLGDGEVLVNFTRENDASYIAIGNPSNDDGFSSVPQGFFEQNNTEFNENGSDFSVWAGAERAGSITPAEWNTTPSAGTIGTVIVARATGANGGDDTGLTGPLTRSLTSSLTRSLTG